MRTWSLGLVVMGDDSCARGCGFKSRTIFWMDMTFFTLICCKHCIVCLKRLKIKRKRGPNFFKNEKCLTSASFWPQRLTVSWRHFCKTIFCEKSQFSLLKSSKLEWTFGWPHFGKTSRTKTSSNPDFDFMMSNKFWSCFKILPGFGPRLPPSRSAPLLATNLPKCRSTVKNILVIIS